MSAFTDDAVILRLTEFSESSQIVTLFTRQSGQIRLIAKGVRRGTKTRFAAGLDLLERGDVTFHPAKGEAGLGILAAWSQRSAFPGLRRTLESLYAAIYAVEAIATLTLENDPHEALFSAIVELLARLDAGEEAFGRLASFQRQLLAEIGYYPELARCMDCGRVVKSWQGMYLSATAGGLICGDCEMHHVEKRRLPDCELRATREDTAESAGAILGGEARAWFEVFDYYMAHLAGRPLRSAQNLLSLTARRTR